MIALLDGACGEAQFVAAKLAGAQPREFVVNLAYRLPDRSLVLFGSAVHDHGVSFTSRIVHVDPTLRAAQFLELARGPFQDSGFVKAASSAGREGEFVAARGVFTLGSGKDERRGAMLDFIQLK